LNPAMAMKFKNFIYLSYEPVDLVVLCFFAVAMALILWKIIRGRGGEEKKNG